MVKVKVEFGVSEFLVGGFLLCNAAVSSSPRQNGANTCPQDFAHRGQQVSSQKSEFQNKNASPTRIHMRA